MRSFITPTLSHAIPLTLPTPPHQVLIASRFHTLGRKRPTRGRVSSSTTSVGINVSFPEDYYQLLEQAKVATELALMDGKKLMEIEFPTAGLESVPGDGEGGIEMTGSMQLIREFCDCFVAPEKATRTRIFFPEANEVEFARKSAFGGASFKLDYLTKPSLFEDFGFVTKVKMVDRVKLEDEMFIVAYPYFNVNEMLVADELYNEAVANTSRKMIIFNGELDRIRTGYYPAFFYPKLAALCKTLFPKLETVYYIHNFKGFNGGTLFRCVLSRTLAGPAKNKEQICLFASAGSDAIAQGSCLKYSPIILNSEIANISTQCSQFTRAERIRLISSNSYQENFPWLTSMYRKPESTVTLSSG
ncbi:hypothetical protein IFM89_004815 [Coptis chinensis]|uniref:DUF1995 domain-containing protein n=1 Tax=Coptis chinensis TaxID=261450 RepID=A0A835IU73_9MAGN|nr:hypothetical protein IFM89_004815 [Coptis chinensis]